MDCGLWWYEQAQATYRYICGVHQKSRERQEEGARRMLAAAELWGTLTRLSPAGDLMKFHVAAIKRLADSAFAKHKKGIELGFEEAVYNEQAQTRLYSAAFARFPTRDWSDLFMLYITATGGYALALAGNDTAEFRKQTAIIQDAKNRLAWLWSDIVDANCLK